MMDETPPIPADEPKVSSDLFTLQGGVYRSGIADAVKMLLKELDPIHDDRVTWRITEVLDEVKHRTPINCGYMTYGRTRQRFRTITIRIEEN